MYVLLRHATTLSERNMSFASFDGGLSHFTASEDLKASRALLERGQPKTLTQA